MEPFHFLVQKTLCSDFPLFVPVCGMGHFIRLSCQINSLAQMFSLVRLRNKLLHSEPHDPVSCPFFLCGTSYFMWSPFTFMETTISTGAKREREEEFRCRISEREAGVEDLMALKQRQAILYEIQERNETSSFNSRATKTAKSAPKTQSNMMGRPALSVS